MRNEDAVTATKVGRSISIWNVHVDLYSVSNSLVAIQQLTKGLKKALLDGDQQATSADMHPRTWPTMLIYYEDGQTDVQPSTVPCRYHSAAVDRTTKVNPTRHLL
jgi:hypothetical protein